MGDLKSGLFKIGIISQSQLDYLREGERREAAKAEQKTIDGETFLSIQAFMDHAHRELMRDTRVIKKIIRQAHCVADQLKIPRKRRNKMHAYLAKIEEGLTARPTEEHEQFLEESFREMDPKLVESE